MAEIEDEEAIGEIQVAEYVMLLLAIDTYAGYVEEQSGSDANDDHTRKGISLLRLADNQRGEALRDFLTEKLTREESKRSILRSFRVRVSTPEQAGRRALSVRTALNRGGTVTLNAVFDEARARRAVKTSIAAAMLDDAGEALDRYGSLPVRNMRIKKWIKDARALVGSGSSIHNPIEMAAAAVVDQVTTLKRQHVAEEGTTGADDVQESQNERGGTFEQLQVEATEAARTAMEVSGEDDTPPTKSEVIGIATAVAAAAASDVGNPNNVPEPLRMLDAEQRSAALTDGRVLVAAGAGAGKSTTLVARVKYLVEERKVNPSRILVSSFNKKAAEELKTKIGKAVGGDKAKAMQVGTLHGLFKAAITKYGTPEEQGMFRGKIGILTGSTTAAAVNRLWRKCLAEPKGDGTMQDAEAPSAKQMLMFKTKWSGNGVTPAQAKAEAKGNSEIDAALWYEMYEGLKGGIPGWRPACEGKAEAAREYDTFLRKNREVQGKGGDTYNARLGDFDDMVTTWIEILERRPEVRKRAQAAFDHVMIDESQDLNSTQSRVLELMTEHVTDGADGKSFWMVGDPDQCVEENTPVLIAGAAVNIKARDLSEGDRVISWKNGGLCEQVVRRAWKSSWTWGYEVATESGHTFTASPNHKIWAMPPRLDGGQVFVYLMHRQDLGFRVGTSRNPFGLGSRMHNENADRLWLLDKCPDIGTALELEITYSLRYGIPMTTFNSRGIEFSRLTSIFEKFGSNGARLLEERHLPFDLPHWVAHSTSTGSCPRRAVRLLAHTGRGTRVEFEWSESDTYDRLSKAGYTCQDARPTKSACRYRVRRVCASYRDALIYATELSRIANVPLAQRLSFPDSEPLPLVTVAGLLPGSLVPVFEEGFLELSPVSQVGKVMGRKFVDLDVDDASNFVGGGILSHNSIYAFRGARPDLLVDLDGKEGWKTRLIRTNYRCPPEVVTAANKLVANNVDRMEKEALASPGRATGESSILASVYQDEAATAIAVAGEIKESWDEEGSEISDNAILCRTNKELNAFETALLMRGIPYARKGASSFLSSPETKAFLGYITLVTDTDTEKTQKALVDILNKPNRFFVSPDQVERAVDSALNNYARKMKQAKKTIDPMMALRDQAFQSDLIFVLKGTRSGFKADKGYEQLEELVRALDGLSAVTHAPTATTKDLFDAVLDMPGTKFKVNPDTGRIEGEMTVSFREELTASIKDFGDEEEDVQEEERPDEMNLGNISFLYELAKPNPEDPGDVEISPATPKGFWAKIGRLTEKAKELRIDLSVWDKEQDKLPPEDRKPAPGVFLGTAHSTKGAQWPNVYVQMPKGRFPMEPRKKDGEDREPATPDEIAEQAAELESERRLAYVALTRPSKNLRIVAPAQIQGKPAGMSRFLSEAGLGLGENVPKDGEVAKMAKFFVEDGDDGLREAGGF